MKLKSYICMIWLSPNSKLQPYQRRWDFLKSFWLHVFVLGYLRLLEVGTKNCSLSIKNIIFLTMSRIILILLLILNNSFLLTEGLVYTMMIFKILLYKTLKCNSIILFPLYSSIWLWFMASNNGFLCKIVTHICL